MKDLKLLYVEDDQENRDGLMSLLSNETIGEYRLSIEAIDNFDDAMTKVLSNEYHIVVLDIFKGSPENNDTVGLNILRQIQEKCFIPIIFYSGNTRYVNDLKSQIVGVVTKGDGGIEELKHEIELLANRNLPFIKTKLHNYIEEELKKYFWDVIHSERDKFTPTQTDFSLGYLILRKFGNSLSKEKISEILGDDSLKAKKVHPMAFYLYPTDVSQEYENGEILEKDHDVYVILTPSCDFVERFDKCGASLGRTTGKVLLVKTILFSDTKEYMSYVSNKSKDNLLNVNKLIESRKGDRYFFLPKTPFIDNRVIDFQVKELVEYENLNEFNRLAKLDNPYAASMTTSFIRFYNRIGFPDIDSDIVLKDI